MLCTMAVYGADQKFIVNELLTYVMDQAKRSPMDCIKPVVLDFYCPRAISEAKKLLWECYPNDLPPL